jgi:molecular chaperone GrpE
MHKHEKHKPNEAKPGLTPDPADAATGSAPAQNADAPTSVDATSEAAPASIEERLRAAEEKAGEHHDAWLRAKAETENVRRRAQDDIAKASKFAVERFARELLAVKDSLEAALVADAPSVESMKAGTELTLKQLIAAFEKSSLTEINPAAGDKFDPHFQQAISMVDAEQEPNTVVSVLQKGYLIADRVLRPALVMVAKPKA